MNPSITNFVNGKRVALAGASRSGSKFGNMAAKELRARGYQVFLVHPEAKEIDGEPCYPSLAALTGQVDGLIICLPPSQSSQVLQEAASIGIHNVWLQQGAESTEVISQADSLGLDMVSGKCILMYAPPVRSFHWCHRAVVKLVGKL
jgi:uncharacterized protein